MFKKTISNILLVVAIINHYYYSINLVHMIAKFQNIFGIFYFLY